MASSNMFLSLILLLHLGTALAWVQLHTRTKRKTYENDMVFLPEEQQTQYLDEAFIRCAKEHLADNDTRPGDCPRIWDNIACWPPSPPNTLVTQKCPNYINGFLIKEYATRLCTENGTWFYHPQFNNSWTNYTMCMGDDLDPDPVPVPKILQEHLPYISTMSLIGYSVSLVSLLLAVSVMLYFRKLHCPRNIVHINLFLSLILRAIICILREVLWVDGLGLEKDVKRTEDGAIVFKEEGPHWECKLMMSLFHYALTANYFWIFVEGLYLHMLIFVSIFSEKSRVHWYILIGWASPLLFIIPWIILRIYTDDTYCWNSWYTSKALWLIKGPIALAMIVNFIFFLNIVRVLFTKLRAMNTHEARNYRYRKLARSTLVLIPLFGVPYIVFLGLPETRISEEIEIAKLYFEMFFSSIQGLLVASLFCFLNGEVRTEVKKWWQRLRLRHGDIRRSSQRQMWNTWNTSLTYDTRHGVRPSIQSAGSDDSLHKITCNGKTRTSEIQQLNAKSALGNGKIVHSELVMKPVNGLDKYNQIQQNGIKETRCENGYEEKDINSTQNKVLNNGNVVIGGNDENEALLESSDVGKADDVFLKSKDENNDDVFIRVHNETDDVFTQEPSSFRTDDVTSDSPLLGNTHHEHCTGAFSPNQSNDGTYMKS